METLQQQELGRTGELYQDFNIKVVSKSFNIPTYNKDKIKTKQDKKKGHI